MDMFSWQTSQICNVSLTQPKCDVRISRTSYTSFRAHTVECCKAIMGRNPCCSILANGFELTDMDGIPICGRHAHIPVTNGAGVGHFMAEVAGGVLVADAMHATLPNLTIRVGHGMRYDRIDKIFGFTYFSRYNATQVAEGVRRMYLTNVSLDDMTVTSNKKCPSYCAHNRCDVRLCNIESRSKEFVHMGAVAFTSNRPINAGNYHASVAQILRTKQNALRMLYPEYHTVMFNSSRFNIVIHTRFPDNRTASAGDLEKFAASGRYLPNAYFIKVLRNLLPLVSTIPIDVYLFSLGRLEQFADIVEAYPSMSLQLDLEPYVAMIHMMQADLLITSRSGFPHLCAEYGQSIVLAAPFWHTFGSIDRTITTNIEHGTFNETRFQEIFVPRSNRMWARVKL